jgi:hypothetical protein
MSIAMEVVQAVEANGGRLTVDGEWIVIYPSEAGAPLVEALRQHKPEILALLRSRTEDGRRALPNIGEDGVSLCDPAMWREGFSRWIASACVRHWRLHGGVGRLHVAFAEWTVQQREVPCSRGVFERLVREQGWEIDATRGLVDGLMLRKDADFTRFADALSADRKDSANCKVPAVRYIGGKHAATVESLPVPSHSHVSSRRGKA